ncbi:NIPSNAP family protein [Sedimentibacter hydroxybenzoicus DSM 7310]|uniref:NIPSNAP family protein n=1 Tax=Sedimentibacter hydroxybenzoicus DSM 7310 TaxID=1123245 RepID=A0A974BJ95_SEDHY|nr:NIPSNAP family protein [Sedimentibacter hydroxybenzoicus]NYB73787.1 NIPSNAP family protein [Sedimentibacter hydroxybenzoicus DSM 7310]
MVKKTVKTVNYAIEQFIDFSPPMPMSTDEYVELANKYLLPAQERLGFRVIGAWEYDSSRLSSIYQILGFESLEDIARFEKLRKEDADFAAFETRVEELAPEKQEHILKVALDNSIAYSTEPHGVYSMAFLDAHAGKLQTVVDMALESSAVEINNSRITFTATRLTGKRNVMLDLWYGHLGRERDGYAPYPVEGHDYMRNQLRAVTYDEKILYMYPLPYSPLK